MNHHLSFILRHRKTDDRGKRKKEADETTKKKLKVKSRISSSWASHLRTTGCHRSMVLTILLAARHKRAHPTLTPAGEGWYSIYLPRRDGRLSWPRCLITRGPGINNVATCANLWSFDAHCCHMGTAMKHPVSDRVRQTFVIFDIRALWHTGCFMAIPIMTTVGVKGLRLQFGIHNFTTNTHE